MVNNGKYKKIIKHDNPLGKEYGNKQIVVRKSGKKLYCMNELKKIKSSLRLLLLLLCHRFLL